MALADKLKEKNNNQELMELMKETKRLNELMKSYINVQMDKNTTKKMSLEKELKDIKEVSSKIQNRMISILKKQETLLIQNKNQLQKTLETGQMNLKENTNKVLTEMHSIENELSKGIERLSEQNKKHLKSVEQETSDLVAKTRKSALINHWIDAFKYGFATAVILLPVLVALIKFNVI